MSGTDRLPKERLTSLVAPVDLRARGEQPDEVGCEVSALVVGERFRRRGIGERLTRAIEGEAQFEVDDCELQRDPPSYTIDTVEKLREKYSGAHLFLLIGDDNLAGLPSWRGFEDLRHIVTFIVLQRAFTPVTHEYLSVDRRIDISATEIRNRIASGRSIHYLVPRSVEQIIRSHRLYLEVAK